MAAPGLRVIAGSSRGRRLVAPKGDTVRPTKDRVKASVFSALESRGLIIDAVVLDLFAGSGSLAIEALSRGAASATVVERHGAALEAITMNRAVLNDPSALRIHAGDVGAFVAGCRSTFDLVFCDPPYDVSNRDLAGLLVEVARLTPGGTIVIERPVRPAPGDVAEMPHPSDWGESWRRVFGDTLIVFSTPS